MYRDEFIPKSSEHADLTLVELHQHFDAVIGGEEVSFEVDYLPFVGKIERIENACYRAAFHTAVRDDRLKIGYFQEIRGEFTTLDEALVAIATNYDSTKDNVSWWAKGD